MSERTIRLLEDRVSRVTRRIGELIAERTRLDQEVGVLRERVAMLERDAAAQKKEKSDAAIDWAQVAGTLRAAAQELRRD